MGLFVTLSIKTFSINNTQHNSRLSVIMLSRFIYCYAKCHYAERHYAECHGALYPEQWISWKTFSFWILKSWYQFAIGFKNGGCMISLAKLSGIFHRWTVLLPNCITLIYDSAIRIFIYLEMYLGCGLTTFSQTVISLLRTPRAAKLAKKWYSGKCIFFRCIHHCL
jgi:hypothetical protein